MAARGRSGTIAFETAALGEHVTRPPRKQSPARRRTERSENETIRSRRSELGGGERPDRSSSVGDWSTLGSQGAPISSVIPVRRETWGAARFRRGLEAPAPTGQATRSGRRPRRAPGSSRRRRTGPPARRRGTSADGGGKAMPPSRGCWRGARSGRFGSSFRSRTPGRWGRSRCCRCPHGRDRAVNGERASLPPRARRGLRVPRPRSARRRGCGPQGAASGACRAAVRR